MPTNMPNRPIQAGLQPGCRIAMLLCNFAFGIARRKQISREPFTSFEVIFPLIACVIQAEYRNSQRPPRPQIYHSGKSGLVAVRITVGRQAHDLVFVRIEIEP